MKYKVTIYYEAHTEYVVDADHANEAEQKAAGYFREDVSYPDHPLNGKLNFIRCAVASDPAFEPVDDGGNDDKAQ